MTSDTESFGWVSTDSEPEESLNKMVKLEKLSSDEDVRHMSKATNDIVSKQEKVTPVKHETNGPSRIKRISNETSKISKNLNNVFIPNNIRHNGSISDYTRGNQLLLDNYIESNSNLTKCNKVFNESISEDDEIFLLQCPPNMDIDYLVGLDFLDRDKKKFKLGKSSYECVLSNNKADKKITLLIPPKSNSDYRLCTFNVQGSYMIKERIKINNEIEVIEEMESVVPFPTNLKERHPLFGASYKSSIKITSSVKEKFNSPVFKLPKSKKMKEEPMVVEEVVEMKKTKKRKAESLEEEHFEPRKKIKKENTWMTETSIEKNLFDVPIKSKKKSKQSL